MLLILTILRVEGKPWGKHGSVFLVVILGVVRESVGIVRENGLGVSDSVDSDEVSLFILSGYVRIIAILKG